MDHLDKKEHNHLPHSSETDFSGIMEVESNGESKGLIKRLLLILAIIAGVLIFATFIYGAVYFSTFKDIYVTGMSAKNDLEAAQHAIINRDFITSKDLLASSNEKIVLIQNNFNSLPLIRFVPYIKGQVKAVDSLLVAGVNLTSSGGKLVGFAEELTANIKNESLPYSEISDAQRKTIIRKIVEAEPLFIEVQSEIQIATEAITEIEANRLLKQLADVVVPLQDTLPLINKMVDQIVPMIQVFPKIVGFDEQKNYLFLIQNSNELRPTGGFIGTYGVLKLLDGGIEEFKTDNVYNLDRAFQDDDQTLTPQQVLNIPTPAPIETYLEQRQWALRDANWDADFPSTARWAIDIYNQENKAASDIEKQIFLRDNANKEEDFKTTFTAEDIDGVIAITPELIEGLLGITGPIVVDGIRFTKDNFLGELEYYTQVGYKQLGLDIFGRKAIIKKLADQMKIRLLSLPYSRLMDVLNVVTDSLLSKSILLYSNDPELQKLIVDRGWGGEINQDSTDFLYVVDSNLGSLKSDQFIDRFVSYDLKKESGGYIVTVKITHKHTGEFAYNSTRLRSYTRIYVPLGAELISSSGAMLNDKTKDPDGNPGEVSISEEHGRTVFGAFFVTEPQETNTLEFTYRLPSSIYNFVKTHGTYDLLFQKQPGVQYQLTISLDFDKSIEAVSPSGEISGITNDMIDDELSIVKDQWYTIKFKEKNISL